MERDQVFRRNPFEDVSRSGSADGPTGVLRVLNTIAAKAVVLLLAVVAASPVGVGALPEGPAENSGAAPRRYVLGAEYAVGDVDEWRAESRLALTYRVVSEERIEGKRPRLVIRRVTAQQREFFRFSEQVLAVDEAGVAALRIRCREAGDAVKSPLGERVTKSELEGCTAVVRRLPDGRVVVRAEQGKPTLGGEKELEQQFLGVDAHFLPGRAVATGETWTPDAPALRAQLGDAATLLRCRLQDVVRRDGRDVARIHVWLTMRRPAPDVRGEVETPLTGTMYFDLAWKRVLGLDLSGPLVGLPPANNTRAGTQMVQSGEARLRFSRKWLKVAGMPVAARRSRTGPPPGH